MTGKGRGRQESPAERKDRDCVFDKNFREDLDWWIETRPRVALKLLELVEAALRDPFDGIGKPEPLKQLDANTWSRRLTQEHRMVYLVADDRIVFLQGRYHY
jgi:toxin YoeB